MSTREINWRIKSGALIVMAGLLLAVGVLAQTTTNSTSNTTSDPQTQCTTGGGKWCINSGGSMSGSGYCSYSTSPCPAYDSASCSAQSGEWCAYSGGSGGWCATGGSSCPINDQASCNSKGRTWCNYSTAGSSAGSTGSGWCANVGEKCPAYDEASCKAQGSEWCTSSYGGSGWCSSTAGSCPINDKATCESKGRSWCIDSSSYSTSGGWCASTGSTCPSTSGTTSSTYTPPPATFTWPSTESDCTKYKGVWCKNTYPSTYSAGSCNMAGQTCYVAPPAGKMSCWDGSFVDTYSSCPTTPSTKTDCETKGYKWCDTTASSYSSSYTSSGWCTGKTYNCPTYPPTGKMSCPDGVTFATTLTECPTTQTTVVQPTTKTCPDGKVVDASVACPVTFKTCPDGSKVETTVNCPEKTTDQTTTCLSKGGKWCLDKSGSSGYCMLEGECKVSDDGKVPDQPQTLDEKQTRFVEMTKKEYFRSLESIEKTLKRLGDTESLAKVAALKTKIGALPMDSSVFDALEAIKDDIMTLREVKDDLIAKKGEVEMSERDRAMQERALKQMQKNISSFSKQLDRIKVKMDRLEKQGFVIPATLKELITQSRELIVKIKEAKTPEEAFDAGNALAEISEDLNLWMPRLEQLSRISQFIKMMQAEINKREAAYKRVVALVKRLKLDLEEYTGEVRTMLDAVKETYSQLKTREWSDEEPFDFVQEQIIDKLLDADDKMVFITNLANMRGSVNKIAAKINTYNARIARLVRQKKDVTELKDLVDNLKEVQAELKTLAAQKLADLDVANVMEKFGAAEALMEEIDDLLKIAAPSSLEKALRGGLKVEKIETPELEKQVIRAYRVATFFRRAPQQTAEYVTGIKEALNKWRNRLALD